jgi:hypothetical protein
MRSYVLGRDEEVGVQGEGEEDGHAQQVGPHVAGLVVQSEQRHEARADREVGAVARPDEGVVLLVGRRVVEAHRTVRQAPVIIYFVY